MLIAAAGSLIGVYVWVVNFSRSHLRSKAIVALTGAGAALLGYLGGAGVCFMAGVISTGTAAAAPLLVVGIGVDDTLVLLQSYSLTVHKRSAADRLQLTLRDSGVGITITTLTNLMTFGIGAFSPYLAIKSFCLLCLSGLFLGYIMCLTFFLGFLALDAKAEAAGQVMAIFRCCPMKIMRDSSPTKTQTHQNLQQQQQQKRQMRTLKGLPMLQYVDKTRLPGADASALSACASDIFQCITMQVEAALQQQQQQRLIEAETRRIRKRQAPKKKEQQEKGPARRKKNAKTSVTSTSSGIEGKKQDNVSSDSEDRKKKTRQRKQPERKTNARKKKRVEARNSNKQDNTPSTKQSIKSGSIRSTRSSAKKRQQQQRQRRAKALRPALKGRRQQQQQQQEPQEGEAGGPEVGSTAEDRKSVV